MLPIIPAEPEGNKGAKKKAAKKKVAKKRR
jgi:hypothetical protein